jgi:shikimate dehydrogenase
MASAPGTPMPVALLRASQWVADIVYFPLETEFLRAARAAGCRTMGGEGMALHQALAAFALFTGRAADAETMRAAFVDAGRG